MVFKLYQRMHRCNLSKAILSDSQIVPKTDLGKSEFNLYHKPTVLHSCGEMVFM